MVPVVSNAKGDGIFQDYGRTGGDIMEQTGSKWLKDRSDMVKFFVFSYHYCFCYNSYVAYRFG